MSKPDQKKLRQQLERARAAMSRSEIDEAKSILKEQIRSFDVNDSAEAATIYGELWYELGRCHLLSRKADKAIQSFENALRTDPNNLEAKLRLAESKLDSSAAMSHDMVPLYILYLHKGPHERVRQGAMSRLQNILRIRLNERPATVAWRMEMLERLIKVAPQLKFPRLYFGRGLYLQEDYKAAVVHLEPLADKSPDSYHLLNMLARSYEKLGRLEEAHRTWDRSLRVSPGQAGVHFRLGRLELTFAEKN